MLHKKILSLIIFILCFLPIFEINAQESRAGFIPGNIWYSKQNFEEGDKIEIYTALFNPDTREFSGTVIFFDKNIFLGKKNFIVNPRSVKDISISWTVTAGDHTISAKIENAKFLISSGKYEEVYISGNQSEESKISVNKKITPKILNTETLDISEETIKNLGKIVKEKTPNIIATPIIATVDTIENLRENIANTSKISKEELGEELKNKTQKETKESGRLETPFKYVKLFFFTLIAFIFSHSILFYILVLIIVFYILRFIWRRIF